MSKEKEIYKCHTCGNIILVRRPGIGTLYCCGTKINILHPNNNIENDEIKEKHNIIIDKITNIYYIIKIGEKDLHPMTNDHFIDWLEIELDDKTLIYKNLNIKEKPEIIFDSKIPIRKIRCYCNIHGLWEKEF